MGHMMPEDYRFSELRGAAKALGVAGLAGDDHAREDPAYRLQLAAAVLGAADAYAMVQASMIANGDGPLIDPIEIVDRTAYRAAGMRGNNPVSSHGLWSIWTMRRLRAHLADLLRTTPNDDLIAATVLLDAVHALLSGYVYGSQGGTEERDECREVARQHIDSAQVIVPSSTNPPRGS